MGCQTNYDSATKQITVKKSETVVNMWQGTSKASVNGETVFMDTMPITKSGTVLVPVRFLTTAFGCDVNFDGANNNVSITAGGYAANSSLPSTAQESNSYKGTTDPWGNPLRTTNLPSVAKHFPYIREDIPNWVYDCLLYTSPSPRD